MKKALFLAVLVSLSLNVVSQKANFEMAERFSTERLVEMAGDISVRGEWLKKTDLFWYSFKNQDGRKFVLVDAAKRSKSPLFDTEEMAMDLTRLTNKPYNALDLPLKNLKFTDDNKILKFEVDSVKFEFDIARKTLAKKDSVEKDTLRAPWKNYSPDSTYIVFAKQHNLYLMKANDPDSVEIQLTTDGEKWYSFAWSENDTTNKRIRARAMWFKDSKKLYVKRTDNRKVGEFWVINSLKRPRPDLETYKYAMPGEENIGQDELIVFDVASRGRLNINTTKWKDQSLGGAYFGSGGGFFTGEKSDKLYFIRRDRTWSKIDLCEVNTTTGDLRVLISEESKPYFNTRYAQLAVIEEGKELIWWSERDGWGHLYLYDGNGNLKRQITQGAYYVGSIQHIDTLGRTLYFEAFGREKGVDPYYTMHYKINFDGRNMTRLTPENATHSFSMSESSKYFVSNYSRVDMPPVSVLSDNNGRVIMELERANISRLEEAGWKMPETFVVKAGDGVTDLYGVMWKPFDFDPEKKYPIITYVYPGPQTEPVPKDFTISGARGRTIALAQVGFVVVAVGQRGGSPQRSKYYHNFGYGNLRDYPLEDNKKALEQLAARHSFIDINRVGIYGHSGGGFMSTAAMLVHPDFYKVAVSSAGNHDNNIYNIWWSEVHHGVKETTRTTRKKVEDEETGEMKEVVDTITKFESKIPDNQSLAKNLKGHLLLVHGDMDNNVHPANTLRVVDALIKANKRFDMMIMPGQRHGFGNMQQYFDRMVWYYFAQHLLGDYRNNVDLKDYNVN
jgi:dipeptidyl-peptidase 4